MIKNLLSRLSYALLVCFAFASSTGACPIWVTNNYNNNVWIVTNDVAEKLKDMTNDTAIEKVLDDMDIPQSEHHDYARKFIGTRTNKKPLIHSVGSDTDKMYHLYVQVGNTKQYIRKTQIQVTKCFGNEPKNWWTKYPLMVRNNIINEKLSKAQSEHIALTPHRPNALIKALHKWFGKPTAEETTGEPEPEEENSTQPIEIMPEE